jgi:hypothetical protein
LATIGVQHDEIAQTATSVNGEKAEATGIAYAR